MAAAVGIVVAQQVGVWPEVLQGATGIILPAFLAVSPILPRELRRLVGQLRRLVGHVRRSRRAIAAFEAVRDRRRHGGPGHDDPERVDPEGATTRGPRAEDVTSREGAANAEDDLDQRVAMDPADLLAAHLPDPTMWPPRALLADNDDRVAPKADGDVAEPTAR